MYLSIIFFEYLREMRQAARGTKKKKNLNYASVSVI